MKKRVFLLCVLGMASIFAGAAFPHRDAKKSAHKKNCGYTIIEFGVGIDCNGDTVKLQRAKGFQQAATDRKPLTAAL